MRGSVVVRISGLAGDDGIQVSRGSKLPSASRASINAGGSPAITDCLLDRKLKLVSHCSGITELEELVKYYSAR